MLESVFARFDFRRIEDLFFRARPEMHGSVTDVRMERVECPSCKEETLDAWIYKQSGDWLQEAVLPLCGDCQKSAYAVKLGRQLTQKRQGVIDNDWYFIRETDESGFKNFETVNQTATTAKGKAADYVKSLLAGETSNLRLSGTTGTGKTHLAKAIARTVKHNGKRVAFIEAEKLFNKIKSMFGNEPEQKRFEEHFAAFDLVVIDDVGVETKKVQDVSWTSSEWVRLINLRESKSTVYTTNFDDKKLAEVIGARAESRMSENAELVEMFTPGEDYRKDYTGILY